MIKLYQFGRAFGIPNASPFCMKVECALRMAGLEYEAVACPIPSQAPKGKLPYIEDGDIRLSDSELILDHLRDRHGFDPDQGLSEEQKAISRAFQVLLDERFYWVNIQNRWMDPVNWPTTREAFFGWVPPLVRKPLAEWVRRGLGKQLYHQGLGRHAPAEIYAFGIGDVRALAAWLGEKPYFHGETPTRIDAGLAAYLNNLFRVQMKDAPVRDAALHYPNLQAYAERSMKRWFPEFVAGDGQA
jgi:glutathione S-transferase